MKQTDHMRDTLCAMRQTLKQMGQWGCRGFDLSPETMAILKRWTARPEKPSAPVAPADKAPQTMESVQADLGDCQRCTLAGGRTHIVFGEGNPEARLVFVGEGPGADEDRQGRPFVGPAGQLLDKIIGAMSLSRDQVYICNVIKCRPPGNRDPQPDEIAACRPFLERQLDVVKPQVICTLGAFATQTLLNTDRPISAMRGRFHPYKDAKVMPTFHPAYLLRNPDQKRAVWDDMKKIMALLRIPLPS